MHVNVLVCAQKEVIQFVQGKMKNVAFFTRMNFRIAMLIASLNEHAHIGSNIYWTICDMGFVKRIRISRTACSTYF